MWASQVVPVVKNPPANAGDSRDGEFDPWVQGVSELDTVEQLSPQCVLSTLVVSDSLQPHGLQPARLICPWDSPGKNTGVGGHSRGIPLLQGIFQT